MNDIYTFVRDLIENTMEEKEKFPSVIEIKRKVKQEFDYRITSTEILECLGY